MDYIMDDSITHMLTNENISTRFIVAWLYMNGIMDILDSIFYHDDEGEVELAGDAKELEGMVFQEPTYDKLATTIKMMRGEG